jgi:hypothetical protein
VAKSKKKIKKKTKKKATTRTLVVESHLPVLAGFYERIPVVVRLPKKLAVKLDAFQLICKLNGDRLIKSMVISEALEAYLPDLDPEIIRTMEAYKAKLKREGMLDIDEEAQC